MTIQNLFERLDHIGYEAGCLAREAGFIPDEGLGEEVCHLPDIYEDGFLRGRAEEILQALDHIRAVLRYLKLPVSEEHTLQRFPSGRYGYFTRSGIREFRSGDCLEAKLRALCGKQRWEASAVEHDGKDYYLAGFRDIPLDGLTVRERR